MRLFAFALKLSVMIISAGFAAVGLLVWPTLPEISVLYFLCALLAMRGMWRTPI